MRGSARLVLPGVREDAGQFFRGLEEPRAKRRPIASPNLQVRVTGSGQDRRRELQGRVGSALLA